MCRKGVSELDQDPAGVRSGVGASHPVVQMDLDLSPAGMAMLRESVDDGLMVLLGREKVRVDESASVRVTIGFEYAGIHAAPFFDPPLLLVEGREGAVLRPWQNGRLEVVGE